MDAACANIDVLPTLTAACGVVPPKDRTIDGVNLLPLWRGDVKELPERTLFFQWHRGDVPEKGRAFAARGPRYKLVQALGVRQVVAVILDDLHTPDAALRIRVGDVDRRLLRQVADGVGQVPCALAHVGLQLA